MDDPWISDDGFWRWNGSQWVPNTNEPIETDPPSPPKNVGDIVILPPHPWTVSDSIFTALYYIFLPVHFSVWVALLGYFSDLVGTLFSFLELDIMYIWSAAFVVVYGYHKTSIPELGDLQLRKRRTGLQFSVILWALTTLATTYAFVDYSIVDWGISDWIIYPSLFLVFYSFYSKHGIYFPYAVIADPLRKKGGQVPFFSISFNNPGLQRDDGRSIVSLSGMTLWPLALVVFWLGDNENTACFLFMLIPLAFLLERLDEG